MINVARTDKTMINEISILAFEVNYEALTKQKFKTTLRSNGLTEILRFLR